MLMWIGELDEGLAKRFLIAIWLILAALLAGANVWWSPEGVRGIALGGVVAGLNAIGVLRDTKRIVKWRSQVVYFIGMFTRLLLAIVIIGTFVLKFPGKFSLIGIFVGISVVPITFLLLVIQMKLVGKKPEDGTDPDSGPQGP